MKFRGRRFFLWAFFLFSAAANLKMNCFEKLVSIKWVRFHHTWPTWYKSQCLHVSQMSLPADEYFKSPCACFYWKNLYAQQFSFSCLRSTMGLIELRNSIALCFCVGPVRVGLGLVLVPTIRNKCNWDMYHNVPEMIATYPPVINRGNWQSFI